MTLKLKLLVFLLVLNMACKNKEANNIVTGENPHITLSSCKDEEFADQFELVKSVALENHKDAILGENLMVKLNDENIFVLDKVQMRISRFDNKGNFLNNIGIKGRGPGELNNVHDFIVYHNTAEILSRTSQGTIISVFNINGNYIESTKWFDKAAYSFIKKSDGDYYLYTSYNDIVHNHRLLEVTNKGNIKSEFLKNISSEKLPVEEDNFYSHENKMYFKESFQPIVYEIVNNNLKPLVYFDFEKYSISEEYWNVDFHEGFELLQKQGFANIRRIAINDKYAIFDVDIQKAGEPFHVKRLFWDRNNERCYRFEYEVRGSLDFNIPLKISNEDEFVFIGFPELSDGSSSIGNPVLKFYRLRNSE